MSQICPTHKVDLVHRQGVSKKTGNNYDFWACPQKENGGFCKYTFTDRRPESAPQSPKIDLGATQQHEEIMTALRTIFSEIKKLGANKPQDKFIDDIDLSSVPFDDNN